MVFKYVIHFMILQMTVNNGDNTAVAREGSHEAGELCVHNN